jgi:hypothetical protein
MLSNGLLPFDELVVFNVPLKGMPPNESEFEMTRPPRRYIPPRQKKLPFAECPS